MSASIAGKPAQWREGLIGKVIRFRFSHGVAWRLGYVLPDRDAEDSCLGCCIRVAEFGVVATLGGDSCLRFKYPDNEWNDGCAIEVVDMEFEP